jgi:catechol 2,3-dioxygenase-like lactoylglutathione lyase family enzyme
MHEVSVSFLGLRTRQFDAMRRLYAEAYGLRVLHADPGVAWFELADGAELHVYAADADEYHRFFGDGPVPGLLVEDFAAAVDRLTAHGVQWITEPETAGGRTWRHYRAPDGNVYEVMAPAV